MLVVKGQASNNNKKATKVIYDTDSKQTVWGNPKDFGFRKLYSVRFIEEVSKEEQRNLGL